MNQLLESARRYSEMGWHVFPIKPGQKTPLTAHGVKDATTDADQIRNWWAKWPDANIAVACGKASGIYVVDVDVTEDGKVNGYESLPKYAVLFNTIQQNTPRGGCHLFYRTEEPIGNKVNFLPGVDIRGDGGYVLLAPSIHPNGKAYQWADGREPWNMEPAEYPDVLRPVKRAAPAAPAPTPMSANARCIDEHGLRASLYLAQCDAAVQGQAGHDKLYWAAACMTWGYEQTADQAYDILSREYNPRCMPPWDLSNGKDEKDFRRKITESIKKPPNKPRGWLLHADGYTAMPGMITDLEVQALIVNSGLAPADSLRGVSLPNLSFPSWGEPLPPWTTTGQTEEKPKKALSDFEWNPPSPVPDDLCVSQEDIAKIVGDFKQQAAEANYTSTPSENAELDYICKPTGLLGELCSWINATAFKPQPYLTLACSMAFLGTLFGRKVKDQLGSRTNLYCMAVAKSSAGKNHAMKKIRELCVAADCTDLLGGSNFASDSSIETRMSTNPATLFMLDEIGHLLVHIKSGTSKHHAQIVSLLMQLYSSAGDIYLGREYAEQERQKTIVQPCCCIYGVTTPKKFAEGLAPEQLEDGWLSRCMVFYSDAEPRKIRGTDLTAPPPHGLVEMVRAWAKRKVVKACVPGGEVSQYVVGSGDGMEDPPPEQIVVSTDANAERRFISFDDLAEEEAKKNSKLANSWSKGEENARRFALILACSDSYGSPVVDMASADRACRMTKKLVVDFGLRVIPKIVSGRVEADKRRILEVIEKRGVKGCIKREITRYTRGLNNQQRVALLVDMLEAGEIYCAPTQNGKTVEYWTAEYCPKDIKALYEN